VAKRHWRVIFWGGSTMDAGRRDFMKTLRALLVCSVTFSTIAGLPCISVAHEFVQESTTPKAKEAPSPAQDAKPGREYSGMYSFLKDGEFVQITVEDAGRVTGFVSRYGDGESDKGAFLDQYFRSGKLDGNKLIFTTETVHAVWFDFKGTVERGEGKYPGDESYYVLKGTLTYNTSDAGKKAITHPRDVELKMFPKEASPAPAARN
jgi:hypothetical protein